MEKDNRVLEIIQYIKLKYDLTQYEVQNWEVISNITCNRETVYILHMQWVDTSLLINGNDINNSDHALFIEVDLASKQLKNVVNRGSQLHSNKLKFDLAHKDDIIKWIEEETGLAYKKQFVLFNEKENELYFKGCINDIPVSPTSHIKIKINEVGALALFSVVGHFPYKDEVKEDQYHFSIYHIDKAIMYEQLKLINFPDTQLKEFVPYYAIEEIYIKTDCTSTLNYEYFTFSKPRMLINQMLVWDAVEVASPFQRQALNTSSHIYTLEQAFKREPHPDLQPISSTQVRKCMLAIESFLSHLYPHDSGKWLINGLNRESGYIQALLKQKEDESNIVQRKMLIYLDSSTLEVLNFIDNIQMVSMYDGYSKSGKINVTKHSAFQKLSDVMVLEPAYVYDDELGYYVLCGKLDCQYAVNAYNGKIKALNEL